MNGILFAAGILAILVGLIHSILGEFIIFRNLREGSTVPTIAKPPLHEKHVRILWATWHIASFFGWAIGAVLLQLSFSAQVVAPAMIQSIAFSMAASGLLVLFATNAKHPGWIGLLGVAILCWLA